MSCPHPEFKINGNCLYCRRPATAIVPEQRKRIAELEAKLKYAQMAAESEAKEVNRLNAKLERLEKAALYAVGEVHCDCRKGYNCAVCVLTEALVQDNE